MQKHEGIWVRGQTLLQSYLPHPPPLALVSISNLKKLVIYAKARGGFPNISRDLWVFIAGEKYNLDKNVSSTYFDLFLSVCDESCHSSKCVPLGSFAVFLGLHSIHKECTQINAKSSDERAPSLSESKTSTVHISPKTVDAEAYLKSESESCVLSCIGRKLSHFVQVLGIGYSDCVDYKVADQKHISIVGPVVLRGLDLFFEGTSCLLQKGNFNCVPLSELILKHPQPRIVGVLNKGGDVEISTSVLCTFLQRRLIKDPFYLLATLPFQITNTVGLSPFRQSTSSRRKTAFLGKSNAQQADRRIIIGAHITKRHLRKVSDLMEGCVLKLFRCNEAYLYFLNSYCCAVVDMCRDCRVVVGVVGGTVRINSCINSTFHFVCKRLIINDCSGCTFYVQSEETPLIVGHSNTGLTFAPANFWFPLLPILANDCRIPFRPVFNPPLSLNTRQCLQPDCSEYSILPTDKFFIFEAPFKDSQIDEKWLKLEDWVPADYAKVCRNRSQQMKKFENQLKGCADLKANEIKKKLQEWMEKNEFSRELASLKREFKSKH